MARAEWINLHPVIDSLAQVAEQREKQKRGYPSTRAWTGGATHLRGLVGEYVYGLVCDKSPDWRLLPAGDDGTDFEGVDVKTSLFWRDPDLKITQEDLSKYAKYFVLVAYDEDRCRAAYAGWASTTEVWRHGVMKDYGHGNMLTLNWTQLHPHVSRT